MQRQWTSWRRTLRNVPIGGATRKCKRQKTTRNDDNSDDNNDHKVSVPFNGDIDASIFPDVLKQVLFQPQIPPLMSAPEDFYTGCSSSNSGSSCSIYSFNGEESMMNLMNGYGKGPIRGQGSLVQSGSYWNCWDGMMEFDAPNESQKL
ncbi:uncharacterized protein A4U43_C01F9400 [Asparagus officinalis]|uniref:Uncharacterized protein n=1 Tax=Asparagus officinalis TaxID=4686 RepID=A0A5P1FPT0_ASPOF|nr:uncharacterized protein A4U43_C01F9400 [Asparagus officinalis]